MPLHQSDTIIAPATAAGEGGIGILRISGPLAEAHLLRFFRPATPVSLLESHHLYFGYLQTPGGAVLDEVMAVIMRQPRSYTREDVAEIHCHGGPLLIRRVLDLFIADGLRLAKPGEFTLRAFLNGRLDLARAEAVIDVIRSRSEAASVAALGQLHGRLSSRIHLFRHRLADILALIEAYIDFPEEDLDLPVRGELATDISVLARDIDELLATFNSGRVLREGIAVLILGRPNVGKSSLLNALLGESRAIVTEVPGTTRDFIEENLVLGGIPLRLVDTAGIRCTEDPVEAEGVRRAKDKIATADLVLLVVDGSRSPDDEDFLALHTCHASKVLLVLNKSDLPAVELPSEFSTLPAIRLSAKTGQGLDVLGQSIVSFFQQAGEGEGRETVLLCDRRHREALVRAREALDRFLDSLSENAPPEILALDLRDALGALGQITGETTPDEILERIFSQFCIGK
jgi:tRNA modification GTPase